MKVTAIAASLLGALIAAGAYFYAQRGVYQTEIGEQRSLTLADGSTVELNAQSTIRVRYTERERHIDLLEGQALFHVAKNKARPFIVAADATRVRAVGTQFDVYRKATGTIVTVVEGRVEVASDSGGDDIAAKDHSGAAAEKPAILLAAGEQVFLAQAGTRPTGAALQRPHRADVEAATAWTQKRLVFEDTPLAEVAEEFNRYNSRSLVIADAELRHVGISGLYSSTDPSALIAFLRTRPGIVVAETDTEIRITRKPN
jgi:transmembrane sensor